MNRSTLFGTTLENVNIDRLPPLEHKVGPLEPLEPLKSAMHEYNLHKQNLHEIDKKLIADDTTFKYSRCENIEDLRVLPRGYYSSRNGNDVPKNSVINLQPSFKESSKRSRPVVNSSAIDLKEVIKTHLGQKGRIHFIRPDRTRSHVVLRQSGVDIPRNICHQFRYEICDGLIKSRIEVFDERPMKKHIFREPKERKFLDLSPYNSFGVILRSNLFPPSVDMSNGTNYVEDYDGWRTFRGRDTSIPDQFRVKSDDMSKWSESDVVEKRLYKDWQTKYDGRVKNKVVL